MSAETNRADSNQAPAADQPANRTDPDRNLALELVRATEAAAIACSRYMGFGDKEQVDQAAVDAMRPVLGSVRMNGVVVIGEGEKDEAPMLFNGEHVGDGTGPDLDIAVDPVDGTTLTAKSLPDAVSVLGVSPRGTMFDPGPAVYMEKLVVPAAVAEQVDLDAPIADTLRKIARHADRRVSDLTVAVLDRPSMRHWSPKSARQAPESDSCRTETSVAQSWPPHQRLVWTCWSAPVAPQKVCWLPVRSDASAEKC